MQLSGWRLTRAGRVVIIVLVVQILGLGALLPAPATMVAPDAGAPPSPAPALDAVLPLVIGIDASLLGSGALEWSGSRTARPAPVSRPPELPRAPPAA